MRCFRWVKGGTRGEQRSGGVPGRGVISSVWARVGPRRGRFRNAAPLGRDRITHRG
jgi:hypothetical protein